MLPRAQRLRTDRDIRATLRIGERRQGPNLAVRIRAHPAPITRFAFVISRQVSKRAVIRNRLRRRLREIARTIASPSADVVVLTRPTAVRLSVQQLRTELTHLLTPRPRAPRARPNY